MIKGYWQTSINELFSIKHKKSSVFEIGLEVWGVFLEISKAFEKICSRDLVPQLHQTRLIGWFNDTLKEFISGRKQSALWSNGLVVRTLDYQSNGLELKTTWWLQGRPILSFCRVRANEYQELLGLSGKNILKYSKTL